MFMIIFYNKHSFVLWYATFKQRDLINLVLKSKRQIAETRNNHSEKVKVFKNGISLLD